MILLSKNKAHKYALRFIYIYCRYLALRRYQKKTHKLDGFEGLDVHYN